MRRPLLLPLLLVLACAGPGILSPEPTPEPEPLHTQRISSFEVSQSSLPRDGRKRLEEHDGIEVLEAALADQLRSRGLHDPEGSLALEVVVTGFRFRRGAAATILGTLAGNDSATIRGSLARDGEFVGDFTAEISSIRGGLTVPTSDERMHALMQDLAVEISDRVESTLGRRDPSQIAPQGEPGSPEERLRQLDELYERGLISEEEYQRKRSEVLKEL